MSKEFRKIKIILNINRKSEWGNTSVGRDESKLVTSDLNTHFRESQNWIPWSNPKLESQIPYFMGMVHLCLRFPQLTMEGILWYLLICMISDCEGLNLARRTNNISLPNSSPDLAWNLIPEPEPESKVDPILYTVFVVHLYMHRLLKTNCALDKTSVCCSPFTA